MGGGGKSKKVTTGYRYYMGLHFGVCYGPVDAFRKITAGDRAAWSGAVTSSQQISINSPTLFGGDKKEGGIAGVADVMMGEPTQAANSYLASKIAGLMPAFRGIFGLVYRGQISANNPYIKPFAFKVTRIIQGWNDDPGGCWYPEKAPVPVVDESAPTFTLADTGANWEYQTAAKTTPPDPNAVTVPSSGWGDSGPSPFGHTAGSAGGTPPNYGYPTHWDPTVHFWVRKTISVPEDLATLTISGVIENGCLVFLDGVYVGGRNPSNVQGNDGPYSVSVSGVPAGDHEVAIYGMNEPDSTYFNDYTELTVTVTGLGLGAAPAMNPAHIILQCVVEPLWGMGYPRNQVDLDSFEAAADTFYNEGLGLCMLWNQQSDIQGFIQLVCDHAGAIFYSDPKTGKFGLKPIRGDYDPDTLEVYDEGNVVALESFQRPGYGETVNEITVVYRDFSTNKDGSITVQDNANIQAQGCVISQTRQYPGLPTADLAARTAQRDLNAASTPLAKARIRVNRNAWSKVPGDVIKLDWPKLGLSGVIFRVLAVNYGTLTSGELVVELAEDVFGLPDSTYSQQEPPGWVEPDNDPLPIDYQEAYELPYWDLARTLSAADLAEVDVDDGLVAAAAARENGLQTSFDMHTRISPADYAEALTGAAYAPSALVAVAIARSDTEITYSDGLDIDQVELPARAMIGSGRDAEFVEVTAIDTGTNTLTVNRGVLDTTPQEFDVGTRLFFIAEENFAVDPTTRVTGEEVDVKLLGNSGGGSSAIGDATEMQVTLDQRVSRPYPPGKVRINGLAFPEALTTSLTVTWAHRDRLAQTVDYVTQDEDSIGPEAGTTYNAYLYNHDTNVLVDSATGITGTSWSPSASGAFTARLELEASIGGTGSAPGMSAASASGMAFFWLGGPMQSDALYVGGILRQGVTASIRVFFKDDLTLSGTQYVGDDWAVGFGFDGTYFYAGGVNNSNFSGNGVVVKMDKTAGSGTEYELFDNGDPTDLVYAAGALWVSTRYGDTNNPAWPKRGVVRIETSGMTITDEIEIADPSGILSIATDGNYIWAWNNEGQLYRINTATKAIDQTIPGLPVTSLVVGRNYVHYVVGAVFVLSAGRLLKIDPATGAVLWNVDASAGALGNLFVNRGAFIEIDGVLCTTSAIGGSYYLIGINPATGALLWQSASLGSTGTYSAFEVSGLIDGTTLVFGFVQSGTDGSVVYTITPGGGLVSWQRQIRVFDYASDLARITEDSDGRITEDSDSRILE